MSGARTETTIAAQAATGERAVDWERVYTLHAPALLRYLRRLSRDPATAEDLMHETFERAARAGRVPAETELRPWLYRIATNLAVDHLRRRRRFAFLQFSGRERDERAPFDADADLVRRALRAIPPEQAAALVLRLHEGFSRAEIAQLTPPSSRWIVSASHSFARSRRATAATRSSSASIRTVRGSATRERCHRRDPGTIFETAPCHVYSAGPASGPPRADHLSGGGTDERKI